MEIATLSTSRRWLLLVTVAAGLLLVTVDYSVLYTALPILSRELHASPTEGLWIINAYPLVMAGLLLGAGTLGDRLGHRRMFLGGLVIFGIASIAAAFAPSSTVLIGARAALAVGAAAMMPATLALIRITFVDERERNIAISIWGCIAIVGAALGPIIGGLLLARFWWGSVFLINVPVVVVAIIGTLIFAPSGSIEKEKPWDLASSLLALVALSALTLGIKHLAQAHPDWLGAGVAWLVAVGAGYVFVRRQTQLPHPLLDFSIFRNPAFSAGVIAAALTMFSVGGTQLATTQYFQLVAGFTPLQAGLLVSVVVVGTVATALLGGAFLHKLGLRMLISSGLAIAALGAFATSAGLHYGIGWLIAGMVLNGAGLGLVMAVASAAIVGNAPPERAGMASSVEEVSYEFGGLIAVALLGSLLGMLYSTGVEFPPGTPDIAASGVAQAFELATQGGQTDQEIIEAASLAFANAYVVVLWVVGGILGIGAVVARRMLRAYGPGSSASSIH